MSTVDKRLKGLVADVIDERIDADGRDELRLLLSASAESRAYYREQLEFHAEMRWLLREGGTENLASFPVGSDHRRLALIGGIAAAAIAILGLVALILTIHQNDNVTPTATVLTHVSGVQWAEDSPTPQLGNPLEAEIYTMSAGLARLDIGAGVQVFIEGPCRFEPVSPTLMRIHEGRVNAEVSEEGHGFTLWTSVAEFIDLGTRFGIGVGSDPAGNAIVVSKVFEGTVRMNYRQNGNETFELLKGGQARGLAESGVHVEVIHLIDERRIGLDFSKFEEPGDIEAYRAQDAYNLALGKPVSSEGSYYASYQGEVFPASNVTDGRINDTGYPWNWSFWLTPNHRPFGSLVIDLGSVVEIDCVQLLNTRNRHHGDRGSRDFRLSVATEKGSFREIGSGSLGWIAEELSADSPPPVDTLTFEPMRARFVRVWIASYYERGNRGSAGLNEVRVFGASLPAEMRAQIRKNSRSLPKLADAEPNIALGKPASSSGHLNRRFSAHRVIDGLTDDAPISELQRSCWLTANGENGSLVVDLTSVRKIDRIEIQNSGNREFSYRGTERYRIDLSVDGRDFETVARGVLKQVSETRGAPFVPIPIDGKSARFVRFVADSHYESGAGLSELRVYPTPPSKR